MPLFNIGFVIFRDVTQLDFTGPLQVLSRLPQSAIHIIAKSAAPVPSDCGLGLVPTHTVITAGGVTAGIDGLSVIAEIAGETTARRVQLGIEYDPAPPFDSGHPDKAPALKSELLSARYNEFRAMYRTRIEQAAPF
jgi:transcriptional regulator GlxA family with amidase domain